MSSSYRGLEEIGKKRCTEKFSYAGLLLKDDPYLFGNETKFVRDMTTWPMVVYGHIFVYNLESACDV